MKDVERISKVEQIDAGELAAELQRVPVFAGAAAGELGCLGRVDLVHADAGADVFQISGTRRSFWILLAGRIRLHKREADGRLVLLGTLGGGDTFGEVPLLVGKDPDAVSTVLEPSTLIYLKEDTFWKLMFSCPVVRGAVLGNMARRLQEYQSNALHREKLISLGTLAAGLMHELNNPGAAARRAAAQMRANLGRLQQISLRLCSGRPMAQAQTECLRELQEQALKPQKPKITSSIEQSDAEEELAEWLQAQGIENAWKLAPALAAIGFNAERLACAQHAFPGDTLSDPLNWLEALISSVQLVGMIEESVSRVSDLVLAVKKYAYEDKAERRQLDVHDGIESTLVILGHKIRQKELTVEKRFAADLPLVSTCGVGLNQVWTNLLDNAIDAAPAKGAITVRTWVEGPHLCVGIGDDGPGIPDRDKSHIFEPFFTTKPVGEGTGLGLDIVHRIVATQFEGDVRFTSAPGRTEFIVMLPVAS